MVIFAELTQVLVLLGCLLLLVKPFGRYMARVYQGERTLLTPVLLPCENFLYPNLVSLVLRASTCSN